MRFLVGTLYTIGAIFLIYSMFALNSSGYCQIYPLGGSCGFSPEDVEQEVSEGNLEFVAAVASTAIGLPMLIVAELLRRGLVAQWRETWLMGVNWLIIAVPLVVIVALIALRLLIAIS